MSGYKLLSCYAPEIALLQEKSKPSFAEERHLANLPAASETGIDPELAFNPHELPLLN